EQGQVELSEAVTAGCAAELADDRAGAAHVRGFGVVTRQLEGEVRLDRDADVRRAAGVIVPTPFGVLLLDHVAGRLGNLRLTLAAKKRHEQDVFRFQDRITLQLADPMAVSLLPGEEALSSAVDRGAERCFGRVQTGTGTSRAISWRGDALRSWHNRFLS